MKETKKTSKAKAKPKALKSKIVDSSTKVNRTFTFNFSDLNLLAKMAKKESRSSNAQLTVILQEGINNYFQLNLFKEKK